MIIKKYFNLKYNTIYYPFNQDGTGNNNVKINRFQNYGGEKRIDVGGGYVGDSLDDQSFYGIYCKARGLVGFDTDDLDVSITGMNQRSFIRLYNLAFLPTTYTPSSLTLEIYPLTASWESGTDTSADPSTGYCNWMNRTSSLTWASSGAMDVDYSMSATKVLAPGNKHLELDVTNTIQHSLTSGRRYYGFLLKLSNASESTTAVSNWRKSFYAGDFTLPYQIPRLDITYDDYVVDDRDSFVAGTQGKLYFYNEINGSPSEIYYTSASLSLLNEDGVSITSTTAITEDLNYGGYYYANITLPLSAWQSYHSYRDKWVFNFSGGTSISSTNYIKILGPINSEYDSRLLKNLNILLKKEESNEFLSASISFNEKKFMFFRKLMTNETQKMFIPKNSYYRIYAIDEAVDREKFIQSDWDRLSYDKNGCWFNLDKTNFPIGKFYIEIKVELFGETLYFTDKRWYFTNTEDFITNTLHW